MTERRFALLVNPSAGGGRARKLIPKVEAELDRRGIEYVLLITESLSHGIQQAQEAAGSGRTPVVMSGDGLIGTVAGALAETGVAMGILPGGRGNDFARVVGIPSDPVGAVENLAADNLRSVDVGVVNGHRFLCIASCGFDSDANRIANEAKHVRGPLVYAYAALRALAQWRPARFTVELDDGDEGERIEFTGYSVAVANSKAYGGGMFVAPDAVLDDGRLDVVYTRDGSKLAFLRGLPEVFKGAHVDRDDVGTTRAPSVRVSADRPFAVYADGEHITDLPARISVLPRAVEIIAPPGPDRGP